MVLTFLRLLCWMYSVYWVEWSLSCKIENVSCIFWEMSRIFREMSCVSKNLSCIFQNLSRTQICSENVLIFEEEPSQFRRISSKRR